MLRLEASPDDPVFDYPERQWVYGQAATEVKNLDDAFHIPDGEISVHRIRTGHFTVNISVNTRKKADHLVVTMHGARPYDAIADPKKSTAPIYCRRDWDELYQAPILAISDPQTELEWGVPGMPRISTYYGTFQHDLMPEIVALVDKVAEELGISKDNVIIYGSSSGGTASIILGALRGRRSRVITACPYIAPRNTRPNVVKAIAIAANGTVEQWEEALNSNPKRFHPLSAAINAVQNGQDLRVVIAQNVRDVHGIGKQFPMLVRRGVPADGGIDTTGRVMGILFDTPTGHGPEPRELAWQLWKQSMAFFETPLPEQEGQDPNGDVMELTAAAKRAAKIAALSSD